MLDRSSRRTLAPNIGLLSFLFLVMTAEMGCWLRELVGRGTTNLPIRIAYGVAEHGLFLFCCMVLFFNVGAALVAWRERAPSMVRVVTVAGAALELVFAWVLFAVVVYAHICSR